MYDILVFDDNDFIFNELILQTAMLLSQMPSHIVGEAVTADQSYDAINFILSLQVLKQLISLLNLFPH